MGKWLSTLWYEFCRCQVYTGLTMGFSLRWEGGRNIPRQGPALLIANHESFLDPIAVGLTTQRQIHFLARKTLFVGTFGKFLKSVNCVPVDQEGVAKDGLKTILDLLGEGHAVLVFPEGERTPNGEMLPLKAGIQLLIKRAPAPVVPIGIAGAHDAYPRDRTLPRFLPFFMPAWRRGLAVSVGKPLDPKALGALPRQKMLDDLQVAIQSMKDRAQRIRRKV